ncbi:hypothetical protein GCM10011349_00010 [Novosphingobium indicum]|uniref:Uncharacterized protein n=1 Tax=Novosphingobium indicum TaxID=462949 RepID=A0ABQ2J862_9SPHN
MVNHVSPKPDTLSESDSTGFGIIGFVLLFAVGNAPFILSNDEASIVDTRIDIRKCHISVKNNTRYYWY